MPFTVDPLDPAAPPLPIDLAEPDPFHPAVLGDPYPRHLFMRSLEWPEPLPAVLRPDRPYCPTAHAVQLGLLSPDVLRTDRAPTCPPCHGDCRQGRRCPASPRTTGLRSGAIRFAAVAVSLASIAYSIGYIIGTALN